MDIARFAAPEIDRLVLSAHAAMGPRHGERLRTIAAGVGLDSVAPLPTNFAVFLRAGTLTDRIATMRMRYMDPDVIARHLAELVEKGLAERRGDAYVATGTVLPLLDAIDEAQAQVASSAWGPLPELGGTVSDLAAQVAAAATPEHEVAAAHREAAEPEDASLRLLRRLTTLRYIRQHDHVTAWSGRHLTAVEMPAFTALWNEEPVEGGRPGLASLAERGYADVDPVRLTARGRRVRDAIEDDTNVLAGRAFAILGDEGGAELLDALRRLPSVVA